MTKLADEWRLLVGARPWTDERGYRLIDTRGPEGMNQGFHVYAGRWVAVRLIADRDHWEVEARPDPIGADESGEGDWFNLGARNGVLRRERQARRWRHEGAPTPPATEVALPDSRDAP